MFTDDGSIWMGLTLCGKLATNVELCRQTKWQVHSQFSFTIQLNSLLDIWYTNIWSVHKHMHIWMFFCTFNLFEKASTRDFYRSNVHPNIQTKNLILQNQWNLRDNKDDLYWNEFGQDERKLECRMEWKEYIDVILPEYCKNINFQLNWQYILNKFSTIFRHSKQLIETGCRLASAIFLNINSEWAS